MKYCIKCILPETRPSIYFDQSGLCSGCLGHLIKEREVDWVSRERQFISLVADAKSKGCSYDCIVPVSGGKDSWYQVIMAQKYGLDVLAVTWKTHGRTPAGQKNIDKLVQQLNVDHIEYTIAPDTDRRFTKIAFEETGVSGLPMHMAIFTIPLRLAVQMRIPLVLWGENPQLEYGGTNTEQLKTTLDEEWLSKHGCMLETNSESWIGKAGLTSSDLAGYRLPNFNSDFTIQSIFLGSFFKWNSFDNTEVSKSFGFEYLDADGKTGAWTFADIDCDFISIHHFLKWYKFGMSRAFDNLSVQIRYGMITREEALATLSRLGPQIPLNDITAFCSFLKTDTDWFWRVCEKHRNKNIWKKSGGLWQVQDFILDEFSWEEFSIHENRC